MDKNINLVANASRIMRASYGCYARPARDYINGLPCLLVWAGSYRDEVDLSAPDHQIRLSDNGSWWIDHESGKTVCAAGERASVLAGRVAHMMFGSNPEGR